MKKSLLVVIAVVLAFCLPAAADVVQGNIVSTGVLATNTGSGFGAILNVLNLSPGGSDTVEQGAGVWTGLATLSYGYDPTSQEYTTVGTGDVPNGQNNSVATYTISQLAAIGITGSNLGIVMQVNNAGVQTNSPNWMSLTSMSLFVWDAAGTHILTVSCGGAFASCANPSGGTGAYAGVGVGTAGWLFTVNNSTFNSYFDGSHNGYVVGLGAYAGDPIGVSDGPDNWSFTNTGTVTPAPEPGSLALLSAGLIGLGGLVRRRKQ